MKKSTDLKSLCLVLGIALLGLASLGVTPASAASLSQPDTCRPVLWLEVKKLAQECTAQIQAGERCEAIQFFADRSASFRLRGHEYHAQLLDSPYSDGGDLNDLNIRRDDGCQMKRTSVPVFGDLLSALSI